MTTYMEIVELKIAYSDVDANKLLKDGWKLVNICATEHPCFILGKYETPNM